MTDRGFTREERAVLIVLYRCHPEGMTWEEIQLTIQKEGLLKMSELEFEDFHKSVVDYRHYLEEVGQ